MGLEEQIKKEEEELRKLETEDEGQETEEEDTSEAEEEEDTSEKEGEVEKDTSEKEEEPEEDEVDGEDDKADDKAEDPKNANDAAAKLRIERKKRMQLEEQLAAARENREKPTVAETKAKPEETRSETTEEKVARLDREDQERREREAQLKLRNDAINEFNSIEADFAKDTPDYNDASKHMIQSMIDGVKRAYPNASDNDAIAFVQNQVLQIASQAVRKGMNPAEVLYEMAFDRYGFDPTAAKKPAQSTDKMKENLKNIAKNKKRSASALSGGGQSAGARATIEEANKMDLATFGNMSEAEIDELIAQAGS